MHYKRVNGKSQLARSAFTLIELLVVIAIIALLLTIMGPSYNLAKAQVREVVCKSNLRQWGMIFNLYTQSNDGKFHEGWRGASDYSGLWLHALRPYYTHNNDVRTCPSATKLVELVPGQPSNGGGKLAWGNRTDWIAGDDDPFNYGSYGLNGYVCSNEYPYIYGDESIYWKMLDVSGASLSTIPILLDSAYWKSYVQTHNDPSVITYDYLHNNPSQTHANYMASHFIDRHKGHVNAVFFDLSVNPTNIKSLWLLSWNPNWEKRTIPDSDWPDWARGF